MTNLAKTRWLADLRSGKYKKIKGQLWKDACSYQRSAIGVLCEAFMEETNRGRWAEYGGIKIHDTYMRSGAPTTVLTWAGLPVENPGIALDQSQPKYTVVALNDGLGEYRAASFEEIAIHIEQSL